MFTILGPLSVPLFHEVLKGLLLLTGASAVLMNFCSLLRASVVFVIFCCIRELLLAFASFRSLSHDSFVLPGRDYFVQRLVKRIGNGLAAHVSLGGCPPNLMPAFRMDLWMKLSVRGSIRPSSASCINHPTNLPTCMLPLQRGDLWEAEVWTLGLPNLSSRETRPSGLLLSPQCRVRLG